MSGRVTVAGLAEKLRNAKEKTKEAFEQGKSKHGKHWHYDGPDYARSRCEQIIDLYEEKTLPKIKNDVLALLGEVEGGFAQLQKQLRELFKPREGKDPMFLGSQLKKMILGKEAK